MALGLTQASPVAPVGSPPGRAGSSSPSLPGPTTAATRRYAATCMRASAPPMPPPVAATRWPRCARWCGTSGRARPGSSSPPARPHPRAGQERRPPAHHRAAPGRTLGHRDRRDPGRHAHTAQPHRGRRGARRGWLPRLPVRPPGQRGAPYRDHPPRAQVIDFAALPARAETKVAGLLLAVPELVALDLPGLVATAGYPGTSVIPPVSYLLSLLALKLTGIRRVSHVDDLAADPGAALFAGLAALPKATALTTYSYRLDHARQQALLTALGRAMLTANLIADAGGDLDLDFHAIMHWGEDVALERNYVPRRSQRTRSVLSFFAQDASTDTLVYANADLTKATQANEALVFAEHWKALTGNWPAMLVMDQKVTTQAVLAKLDERNIGFLTLRMRSPALTRHIQQLPAAAWRTVRLDRDSAYRRPKVVDEQATLSAYPRPVRQLIVNGPGHDAPTVTITNKKTATAKALLERYARRMGIEQRLAEAIRSFHLDALASAVPLNIDLDVVLTVLAGAICASLRRRLTGYHTATPDTLQRRFLSTSGVIFNHGSQITVRLSRRTYSPVLRQAAIPGVAVPWWGGRTLRFEYQ